MSGPNQGESAIGLAAVFYREHKHGINEIVKADAVIADWQAEFGRFDILEALDIAFARGEITRHNMQNVKSCSLIDSVKASFWLIRSRDFRDLQSPKVSRCLPGGPQNSSQGRPAGSRSLADGWACRGDESISSDC